MQVTNNVVMKSCLTFILLSVVSFLYGQEVKDTVSSIQVFKDSCVVESMMETVVKQDSSELLRLKKELANKDSEIKALQTALKRQKNHMMFADSIILRLANDCFRFKYSRERVDKSINYFQNMYSVQLQQQFAPLRNLLSKYEQYYKEIEGVLNRAQNDYDANQRKWKSPFKNADSPNRQYLHLLKNTHYYKEVYNNQYLVNF